MALGASAPRAFRVGDEVGATHDLGHAAERAVPDGATAEAMGSGRSASIWGRKVAGSVGRTAARRRREPPVRARHRTIAFLLISALAVTAPACNHGGIRPEVPVTTIPPGKVLVLPPRDMVQGGGFHAISPGTGGYFAGRISPLLEQHGWRVLTTPSKKFSHVTVADLAPAIAEGRRINADYVLRLVLGEFLDAFPMTFRPDYAILQVAELWSTKNGALVWTQTPLESRGANLLTYHRLLDELAEWTVANITEARVDPSVFTRAEVVHPAPEPPPGLPPDELPSGGGDKPPVAERLRQLDQLGESGMITPEEYKARRKAILNDL